MAISEFRLSRIISSTIQAFSRNLWSSSNRKQSGIPGSGHFILFHWPRRPILEKGLISLINALEEKIWKMITFFLGHKVLFFRDKLFSCKKFYNLFGTSWKFNGAWKIKCKVHEKFTYLDFGLCGIWEYLLAFIWRPIMGVLGAIIAPLDLPMLPK